MSTTDFLTLFIAALTAIGAISGLIIFFINRKVNNALIKSTTKKTDTEAEQLELEIDSIYAEKVKKWLVGLEAFKEKYDKQLADRDTAFLELKNLYNTAQHELLEQKFIVDQCTRAIRRLFVDIKLPYAEWDIDGNITFVNGEWTKLFGMTYDEAMDDGWLRHIPEQTRKEILLEWESKVIDEIGGHISFLTIHPVTLKQTNVESIYTVVFGIDGRPRKIIGVASIADK